jgi:Fe-S cluster assembly ATP-binding protein
MADKRATLRVENLTVAVEGKQILNGLSLEVPIGEVHAIMGPNGSGKTTLANTLMGHPRYKVTGGHIYFKGEEITGLTPDKRAKRGLFLAMQYPTAIPGVTMVNFLRAALKNVQGRDVPIREFRTTLLDTMSLLKVDESFARRYVNDGFSGGEKKRAEVLQMGILRPSMAIMDETDSGLDIDALRTVAEGINALKGPEMGILLITHYQRMLNYITPDYVHVLYRGRMVRAGGSELAAELEEKGYDWITKEIDAAEGAVAAPPA